MKRGVTILWLLFFTLIVTLPILSGIEVIGETTGKVSAQSTNVSIQVIVPAPSSQIINPKNQTYLTNTSLLLNYSVSGQQAIWYNLDSGVNITITSSTYFNTSQGSHTLYLYANNTDNNITSANVTFYVNLTLFTILYSEYNGTTKGSSTDFIQYTYKEVQNLSSVILEHTIYGKILFNEVINLTDDANFSDNQVNLDTYTNISLNRIELNSTALPNFNTPATLWLYSLSFTNPRILRNGEVCSSSICTKENFSGNVLKFNVTQFTVYSAEETPVEVVVAAPSAGGGAAPLAIKKFTITPEEIKVSLKQGQTTTKNIIITNNENQKLSFSITNPKLEEFIKISETDFTLNAGETKLIILDFLIREDAIPDLYLGKLIIKGDGVEKEVLLAIEIESAKPLFDVKAEIPKKFLYILPGEELIASITIFNLERVGEVDIDIEYIIMNDKGDVIVSESETLSVERQTKFLKEFKIPKEVSEGKYVIYVKVTYNGQVASVSVWFNVGKPPTIPFEIATIALSIFIILTIIIIILYKRRKIKKPVKRIYKVGEEAFRKARLIKETK